jgi:hypothetical protein
MLLVKTTASAVYTFLVLNVNCAASAETWLYNGGELHGGKLRVG